MKRTKIPEGSLPLWKNLTGTYVIDGNRIGPGEFFRAPETDVPSFFRGTIIRIDEEHRPPAPLYTIRRRSTGWYDVVGPDGAVVNEGALRKAEAEMIIDEKNKE